jgi:RHS repeat-associated protein
VSGVEKNEILYAYNGEEYVEVTGLQYLRARFYDPGDGRFISEDPVVGDGSDVLSQNRYVSRSVSVQEECRLRFG